MPRRLGGEDILENLVNLCLACHRNVHKDEDAAASLGHIAYVMCEITPMWVRGKFWAYLDEHGSYRHADGEQAESSIIWLRAWDTATMRAGLIDPRTRAWQTHYSRRTPPLSVAP